MTGGAGFAKFRVGDRVFLFKPSTKTGETRKFARPFHGAYRILELGVNTAKIRRVDRPQDEPLLVAVDRLRQCPEELNDEYWPPAKGKPARKPTKKPPASEGPDNSREATQGPSVLGTDRGLGGDMGAGIPDVPQDGGDVSQDGPDVSHVSQEPEREPGWWTG